MLVSGCVPELPGLEIGACAGGLAAGLAGFAAGRGVVELGDGELVPATAGAALAAGSVPGGVVALGAALGLTGGVDWSGALGLDAGGTCGRSTCRPARQPPSSR